jgi:hypothetical protein
MAVDQNDHRLRTAVGPQAYASRVRLFQKFDVQIASPLNGWTSCDSLVGCDETCGVISETFRGPGYGVPNGIGNACTDNWWAAADRRIVLRVTSVSLVSGPAAVCRSTIREGG